MRPWNGYNYMFSVPLVFMDWELYTAPVEEELWARGRTCCFGKPGMQGCVWRKGGRNDTNAEVVN